MVRLIQKSGYIKSGGASGYMKYIATRERVERLEGSGPVTKGQRQLIENLLRDFPDATELEEYSDYHSAPTTRNASWLISAVLDANAHKLTDRDGYMRYIATRPRVERHGEHGLFSNRPVSLDAALKEVETHTGNVWTFIWSLRREDAARLGYDCAESWRKLIKAHQVEIAEAMKIPSDQLRWCAAFHDEGHHPHVHAMVWSADPSQGRLTKEGVKMIRSKLTNDIFRDEMYTLYQEKDVSYKDLVSAARRSMRELIEKIRTGLFAAGGRRTNARPVQVSRARRTELPGGGDTQGRADARSEAPAPAPHLPRHVAAFGGKRLGCSSLRLRVYRLGSVRGLPRGTDRRDSGAQMLNGIGFGMQENKI